MHRNQRTLVALSGTIADRAVVRYASLLASLGFARSYHFVHVVSSEDDTHTPRRDHQTSEYIDSLTQELFQPQRPDLHTEVQVLRGVPIDALMEYVVRESCDLTLLGHSDGRTGQRRTARRLSLVSPSSVLVIPQDAPQSIARIMAPVDFSKPSADSAQVAISIAHAAQNTECLLTHVYSDSSTVRYAESVEENVRTQQAALDSFVATLDNPGLRLRTHLIEGNDIAGSILYSAEQQSADLLVVSTRGRSAAASILLGSVTSQLLSRSPIAILAVKHFGAMLGLFELLKEGRILNAGNPQTN